MVGELPIPNPFPIGKGLLLCDKSAHSPWRGWEGFVVMRQVLCGGVK